MSSLLLSLRQRIRAYLSNSVSGGIGAESARPEPVFAARSSSDRNREWQKAQRKNNQRDDPDGDSRGAERFHLFRLRMADAQHHREQDYIEQHRRTVVPQPTTDHDRQHQNEYHAPKPMMW